MMNCWRFYCKALFIGLMSLLAGCTILPKAEQQTRYALPASTLQAQTQTQAGVLFVAVPQASKLLSSNLILVQPEYTELQAYKGVLWADNLPMLLRERLINAFTDAGIFKAISGDAALRSDLSLETYIQRFQVQLDATTPLIQVEVDAKIVDSNTASILQSKRFSISRPANSTKALDLIDAFGQATDQLSIDLIRWVQQP